MVVCDSRSQVIAIQNQYNTPQSALQVVGLFSIPCALVVDVPSIMCAQCKICTNMDRGWHAGDVLQLCALCVEEKDREREKDLHV